VTTRFSSAPIERVDVSAYRIPTDYPESDGTYAWDSTTLVLVEAVAGGQHGIGYTYADTATATLVRDLLAKTIEGRDALDVPGCWAAMDHAIRNLGRPGIASMAISAVDVALWDLKAKLLDIALVTLLGATQDRVPIYGSGGFTSYPVARLQEQLGGWVAAGIPRVKMKIGTHPADDLARVRAARAAIGPEAALYVDANGAYSRKQALAQAARFREEGVVWFEEPVPSSDLAGLHLIREMGPAGMDIAAGEYGYDLPYFQRMLDAGAVDCLQADVTRCLGITGVLKVGALCDGRSMDLSLHCAPQISAHVGAALWHLRHLEYFHDHVRIETMAFDGVLEPEPGGRLRPDRAAPGHGLTVKHGDLEQFRVC
jgi:L-alanine-DL-glutamate epimerase-like enolase superfamily enzyme